jgi:hypothetical protein
MKISEFGTPKNLEEGVLSSMLGATPVAAVSGLLSRKGTKQTLTQNAFIKDFVEDAITSISNGISGKFIDPKKTMAGNTPPPAPAAQPASLKPNAAVPTTSPTQVPPAQQIGQTMSPQQTATAKMQTKAGIQPTGQKMTASQRTQARLQNRKMQAAQKARPVREETSYDRLNSIFENIIEATDPNAAATPDSGKPSIGDYMYDWFNQYMNGVNWKSKEAQIIPYLEKIEKDYNPVTKAKGAITQLAQVAYALSKAYGAAPRGALNAKPPAPAPAATDDIDTKIADLAKDPKAATAMKNWAAKNA